MGNLRLVAGYSDLPAAIRPPGEGSAAAAERHAVPEHEWLAVCGVPVVAKDAGPAFGELPILGKCQACLDTLSAG
jgi:hypothetical protein